MGRGNRMPEADPTPNRASNYCEQVQFRQTGSKIFTNLARIIISSDCQASLAVSLLLIKAASGIVIIFILRINARKNIPQTDPSSLGGKCQQSIDETTLQQLKARNGGSRTPKQFRNFLEGLTQLLAGSFGIAECLDHVLERLEYGISPGVRTTTEVLDFDEASAQNVGILWIRQDRTGLPRYDDGYWGRWNTGFIAGIGVVGVITGRCVGRWRHGFCFDLELDFGDSRHLMEDSFFP
jgi:hypothetical protein